MEEGMTEQTLVLVKPDGVRRGLVGEVIGRFERRGLRLRALKMLQFDGALADRHYSEHVDKPFYPDLKRFITSGPVVAMVVEGPDAISLVRTMMGPTKAIDAPPGTMRGDFATTTTENIIHGSDSPERAAIEKALFFRDEELL
jgi:nucleoside-diphosphate kinase